MIDNVFQASQGKDEGRGEQSWEKRKIRQLQRQFGTLIFSHQF